MSSGGKGGSKTQETTIPDWIKQPAIRNMQRAEDVQRIEYMPYYGADVAAFTPTQNAAFQNNIDTAKAFGLLDPNSTLTPTSGMPTPTDYNGFTGYSSQPMYESALAELKAKQPGAVAQYDALFGANVPTTWGGGGGNRFRGSASSPSHNPNKPYDPTTAPYYTPMGGPRRGTGGQDREAIRAKRDASRLAEQRRRDNLTSNFLSEEIPPSVSTEGQQIPWQRQPVYSSRLDTKGYTPQTYKPLDQQMQKKKVDKMIPDNTVQKVPFQRKEVVPHYRPTEKNVGGSSLFVSHPLSEGATQILARDLKNRRR